MGNDGFVFQPLTKDRWNDIVKLFGERGACGGCWCMSWRLTRKEFDMNKGEGNKKLLKELAGSERTPGIIAYHKNVPVGWCAFAPREEYVRLEKSRVLKKIDEEPVLSVSCFFIKKDFRKKGLSVLLLNEVKKYAREMGIKIIEGYPATLYGADMPAVFAWTGLPAAFEKAGFFTAAQNGKRKIMRFIGE